MFNIFSKSCHILFLNKFLQNKNTVVVFESYLLKNCFNNIIIFFGVHGKGFKSNNL